MEELGGGTNRRDFSSEARSNDAVGGEIDNFARTLVMVVNGEIDERHHGPCLGYYLDRMPADWIECGIAQASAMLPEGRLGNLAVLATRFAPEDTEPAEMAEIALAPESVFSGGSPELGRVPSEAA